MSPWKAMHGSIVHQTKRGKEKILMLSIPNWNLMHVVVQLVNMVTHFFSKVTSK